MPILPLLCTGVVFSSMFFGLRGMAYLPVESLTTGGALWFTDLTAIDPYIILPLMTAGSLFISIKLGADGVDRMPPSVRKIMEYIPLLMPVFMSQFPHVSSQSAYIYVFESLFLPIMYIS